MARKYTKTILEAAADDFNKVIGFDPPIVTGKETTVEQLINDITDIVNNHLAPEDKMTKETIELIELMGLKMPVDEEEGEPSKEIEPLKEIEPSEKIKEKKIKDAEKVEEGKEIKKEEKIKDKKIDSKKSRYGHKEGSQAAAIDEAIFKGGTLKELSKEAKVSISRVKSHIKHLIEKKNLNIVEKEGVFKIE